MADIFTPKNAENFYCKYCYFQCRKESDWKRHLSTRKHQNTYKRLTLDLQKNAEIGIYGVNLPSGVKKRQKNASTYFMCECGCEYKHRQSLYKHKKQCYINEGTYKIINTENNTDNVDKELLVKMLLKNQDVMEKMIEMLPNVGNNSHNVTTNSNNTFNIQMFLNEHCKNAMNLTDFIDSLPITNETYDKTIENGLTNTITDMMLHGLSNMDILERPIHCTDSNRKTLYVKDQDVWEKDTELNKIINGIKKIALKQRTMISKWQDANAGWDTDDNLQTKLTNLVFNSMTNIENEEKECNKIIRAISKSTYLDTNIKNEFR